MFPRLDQSLWAVVIAVAVAVITAGAALLSVGKDRESSSMKAMFGLGLFLVAGGLLLAGWPLISIFVPLPPPEPEPPTASPTPTHTPTATPTGTTPTPTEESDVQIDCIFYDGLVPSVESDEYVQITNSGTDAQNLEGWSLVDISEGEPRFVFPSFVLRPGQSIRLYTNQVQPDWGGFSFGSEKAVWNNIVPDEAALYNAQDQEVSRKSYPPGCEE